MTDRLGAVRNLLYNLVRRDLTVRYKSTVLGFFWSFIKPLALTAIFWAVFDRIMGLRLTESNIPFALHLLTGILAWTFFAGATGEAMNSILANANLIKKVKLPLAVFPLAAVCSHLVHYVLALLVLVVLLVWQGLVPTPAFFWVPAIMALQFALTLAVALALSALNVFYRDIASIWEVATTAWFYATPIIYPLYQATDKMKELGWGAWMKWLYLANPMAPIVLAYRRVILYAALESPATELPDSELWESLGLCFLVSLILMWAGWRIFLRFSRLFADEL